MISIDKALEIILDSIKVLEIEKVEILSLLDRVLAEDISSDVDIPPFDNSAMDGYALIASDTKGASLNNPKELQVIEDLPAGYMPKKQVIEGQVTRIMTGAPIPQKADAVIMVEDTKAEGETVKIFKEVKKGENIRNRGEDIKRGDLVIKKGNAIRPAEIGLLASLGISSVSVFKKPNVAILATGDELVPLGQELTPGKIRSSNSYTLYGQVLKYGGIPIDLGIACDKPDEVKSKIKSGLTMEVDMILTSGGISVGDYDLVKDVLAEFGTEMKFWKVAMKPGKPLAFGIIEGRPIFGLPGNPVSSMVAFEQFVRPAMLKMMGKNKLRRVEINAILEEDIQKKPGKVHFVRAHTKVKDGTYHAALTGPQGSGILRSMSLANSLIVVPEDVSFLKKGDVVRVQLLNEVEEE